MTEAEARDLLKQFQTFCSNHMQETRVSDAAIDNFLDLEFTDNLHGIKVVICGPNPFNEAATLIARAYGLSVVCAASKLKEVIDGAEIESHEPKLAINLMASLAEVVPYSEPVCLENKKHASRGDWAKKPKDRDPACKNRRRF